MKEFSKTHSLEDTLLPWIGRAHKSIDFVLTDKFKELNMDLTKAQIIVLRRLTLSDGIPQNNLAFITDRDKTSLTRLIKTMERKGLVERRMDENDKRVNLVFITKKGLGELQSAFPVIFETMTEAQTGVNPDELNIAKKVLKQMIMNLNGGVMPSYDPNKNK